MFWLRNKKFLYPPQTLFVVGILFSRCQCVCVCASVCASVPANFVCGGYTVFTLSVRVCVRASVCASVRP